MTAEPKPEACPKCGAEFKATLSFVQSTNSLLAELTSQLAAEREKGERLRKTLEAIASETPRIEMKTGERDKIESWCSFASRLQSWACVAAVAHLPAPAAATENQE